MSDPTILPIKPGSLRRCDKKRLADAGVVVIEVDDPLSVRLLRAHSDVSASDMLMSALKTITETGFGDVRKQFMCELFRRMRITEAAERECQ